MVRVYKKLYLGVMLGLAAFGVFSTNKAACPAGQVMDDVLKGACRPECSKKERFDYEAMKCVTAKERCEKENGTWISLTQSCQHFRPKKVREPVEKEQKELKERFGQDVDFVRRLVEIDAPAGGNSDQVSLIVVVHGTFSKDAKDFVALNGESFFSSLSEFAKQVANKEKTKVHLMSVQWSGKNTDIDRQLGAEKLARIINTYYGDRKKTPHIMSIAHSHGCNVINITTNRLRGDAKIDTIVHFAPPVRQATQADYIPTKMSRLISFYGHEDLVQTVGSVNADNPKDFVDSFANMFRKRESSPRKYQTIKDQSVMVYNILVRIEGQDVGHTDIRDIVPYLAEVLEELRNYQLNGDLVLNIIPDPADVASSLCMQQKVLSSGLKPLSSDFFKAIADCAQEKKKVVDRMADREQALIQGIYKIDPEYVLMAVLKSAPADGLSPADKSVYDQELARSAEQENKYRMLYKRDMKQKQPLLGRIGKYAKRAVTGDL